MQYTLAHETLNREQHLEYAQISRRKIDTEIKANDSERNRSKPNETKSVQVFVSHGFNAHDVYEFEHDLAEILYRPNSNILLKTDIFISLHGYTFK